MGTDYVVYGDDYNLWEQITKSVGIDCNLREQNMQKIYVYAPSWAS